jgi:hypothetical protein
MEAVRCIFPASQGTAVGGGAERRKVSGGAFSESACAPVSKALH